MAGRTLSAKPWSSLLLVALAMNYAVDLLRLAGLQFTIYGLSFVAPVFWGFWQISIASPLRARLRYSPEWGYVSFFVPIVNLVVPYFAMRELFFARVRDARRQHLWLVAWWLTYLGFWASLGAAAADSTLVPPPKWMDVIQAAGALCAFRVVHLISSGALRRGFDPSDG